MNEYNTSYRNNRNKRNDNLPGPIDEYAAGRRRRRREDPPHGGKFDTIISIVVAVLIIAGMGIGWHFRPQVELVLTPSSSVSPSSTPMSASPTPDQNATVGTATQSGPTATPDPWLAHFTDGEILTTDNSYQSANLNIKVETVSENDVTYYVADIYCRDVRYLMTAFANDTVGKGIRETTSSMAQRKNAVLAISGDYYGYRSSGIIIRNGQLYRDNCLQDVLALFPDGSMQAYHKGDITGDQLIAQGCVQSWSFGPSLLENGQAKDYYDSGSVDLVNPRNPRTGIGYLEPNHYLFVVVDGRSEGYSVGLTLSDFAKVFADRGCSIAYNLDGGGTSTMVFNGVRLNKPLGGTVERGLSDIIYVGEQ